MKVNIDFDGMKVSRTQKLKDVRVIAYEGNILTDDLKEALLQLASKVAYIDDQGQQYYDDLYDALYPPIPATSVVLSASTLNFYTLNTTQTLTATVYPDGSSDTVTWSSSNTSVATVSDGVVTALAYGTATITATAGSVSATCSILVAQASLVSISADYTQSGTVYSTDSLDSLKSDLVVKAQWSDSSESTLQSSDYTLSGTLTAGTSTITVTYVDKTATFSVTVTENTVSSISAVFTQGSAVIYPDDSLDTLKQYLVVTATYSDTSSATVPSTDYTLSGTLAAGTSTITVTYSGKTTTFTVTVTDVPHWANNVMTITKDNGIVQGKIGNAYPYHNESGSANRCTYCGLEADVSTEYKYTFNYTTTLSVSTNIGVQCVNYAGVQAATNHNTMQDAQRNDYGWQSDGFVLYPKTWDKTAWFTFRRENGTTAVYPADFPQATITREKVDWVNNVMTLTNDWFISGGLLNTAPKYNSTNSARVSYNGMAVNVESGYKYTIHYTTTLSGSTNIGVQYLDDSDLTKYATAQNVETTDKLWQDDGYVFKMSENPTAKRLWFCFRAGDGTTSITPSNFPQITITREAE